MFKPRSASTLQTLTSWVTGMHPEFSDPKFPSYGEGREGVCAPTFLQDGGGRGTQALWLAGRGCKRAAGQPVLREYISLVAVLPRVLVSFVWQLAAGARAHRLEGGAA